MYLATSYWRGSLHISNMREFDEEQKAQDYVKSLDGYPNFVRIYKLSETEDPILIRIK